MSSLAFKPSTSSQNLYINEFHQLSRHVFIIRKFVEVFTVWTCRILFQTESIMFGGDNIIS